MYVCVYSQWCKMHTKYKKYDSFLTVKTVCKFLLTFLAISCAGYKIQFKFKIK